MGGPPEPLRLVKRLAVAAASAALLGTLLPVPGVFAAVHPAGAARQVIAGVATPSGATAVAAGLATTCALVSGGTAYCWGANAFGELGNGMVATDIPIAVRGVTGATAIRTAGEDHTCALLAGSTVYCWGANTYGQLGSGSTTNSSIPVAVRGITSVTAIAVGDFHNCAIAVGGHVDCWGYNPGGENGDGTTTDSSTPVAVTGIVGATAIAAGNDQSCAVLTGGSVDCWGANISGDLGDGTTTERLTPVSVGGLSGATAIATGLFFTCAIVSGGAIACWGGGNDGELGNGTSGYNNYSLTPVAVSGLVGATGLGVGSSHACALLAGGTVDCWGANSYGQLGDGTTTSSSTPVAVTGITGAIAIAAGGFHTCALLAGGSVKCWGAGTSGELGNGTYRSSSVPVTVLGLTGSLPAGLTVAWFAKVGRLGVNGTASLATVTPSAGAIGLKLVKLHASSTLAVTLYKGTCSSVGPLLVRLASITTTKTGTASRTSTLTAAQVKLVLAATAGAGKIAIRIGTGSGTSCGAFARHAVPGPHAVVQAFYDYYLTDQALQDLVGRPDLAPSFVRSVMSFSGGANPIVCAQNVPPSFTAGSATISGATATVKVTSVFGSPTVKLTLGPTGWQISAVDCGFRPLP